MSERDVLSELSRRVWDERHVVTYLLFKLTVARLLLAADEHRFVPDALAEVDRIVQLLRDGEAQRDQALRELAGEWQVDPRTLTLTELARRSPPPFDHTFGEHRRAFERLAEEIDDVAQRNRELANAGFRQIAETLDEMTGSDSPASPTYDASGQLDPSRHVGHRLREVL